MYHPEVRACTGSLVSCHSCAAMLSSRHVWSESRLCCKTSRPQPFIMLLAFVRIGLLRKSLNNLRLVHYSNCPYEAMLTAQLSADHVIMNPEICFVCSTLRRRTCSTWGVFLGCDFACCCCISLYGGSCAFQKANGVQSISNVWFSLCRMALLK